MINNLPFKFSNKCPEHILRKARTPQSLGVLKQIELEINTIFVLDADSINQREEDLLRKEGFTKVYIAIPLEKREEFVKSGWAVSTIIPSIDRFIVFKELKI